MSIEKGPTDADIAAEAAAMYPDTNPGKPTPEEIAAEAHAIYLNRGGEHGRDVDDWLEAERRLGDRQGRTGSGTPDDAVVDPARLP